jgi:hypothetical protein
LVDSCECESVLFHNDDNDSHRDDNDDHGDKKKERKKERKKKKVITNAHTVTLRPTWFCPALN